MQTSKGFNPFLAEASAPAASSAATNAFLPSDPSSQPASNPFLDFGSAPAPAADNPFLNFTSGGAVTAPAPSAVARNPFADFGAPPDVSNGPFTSIPQDYAPPTDFIGIPQDSKMPHNSTQDLLESVTGQLEATSDSLLHRLRVNQPSPIPQVPSPTPSPRTPSPDLMMGDETPMTTAPPVGVPPPVQTDSILDLMDDTEASSKPKTSMEILGLYHHAPKSQPPLAQPVAPVVESILDISSEPAAPSIAETRKPSLPATEAQVVTKKPEILSPPEVKPGPPPRPASPTKPPSPAISPHTSRRGSEAIVSNGKPSRPELPLPISSAVVNSGSPSKSSPGSGSSPVKPGRPPPPPPEAKAMPSRPPPPVPPAPRASPQPPSVVSPPKPTKPQPPAVVPTAAAVPAFGASNAAPVVTNNTQSAQPFGGVNSSPFSATVTEPKSNDNAFGGATIAQSNDPFGAPKISAPQVLDPFDAKFESLDAAPPAADAFAASAFGDTSASANAFSSGDGKKLNKYLFKSANWNIHLIFFV